MIHYLWKYGNERNREVVIKHFKNISVTLYSLIQRELFNFEEFTIFFLNFRISMLCWF